MNGTILIGDGREIRRVPDDAFVRAMEGLPARMASRLAFMTRDHHAVRDYVVREIPQQREPLSPTHIANTLGLGLENVTRILSDLEQRLFFLVRDPVGNVNWAYPVTTTATAHRLTFSSGERTSGA